MSSAPSPASKSAGHAAGKPAFLQIDDVVKDFGGGAVAVNHVSIDIA